MTETLIGLSVLFTLLFIGLPIGFGMMVVGVTGFAWLTGWGPAFAMFGQIAYETPLSYNLSVLPLFLLMGNFIAKSRLSEDLYNLAYVFLGHRRGGLAMATLAACGGFSAVCGSSLATAATMAKVAIPSMRRYGYADSLAAGSIAAGGTLGILIPPSTMLVLYGILTETDIGALFIAGILPGILGIVLYIVAVGIVTSRKPELGPPGERSTGTARWQAIRRVWGVLVLFVWVMGGIYFGIFTPTEAAGMGATGAFCFVLGRRALTWRILLEILVETARTSAMMFIMLIGALLFSNFVNVAGLPTILTNWLSSLQLGPMYILLAILAIYLMLGCILETLSMLLLTMPIFFPIVQLLGFDPVWFGILVVVAIEISLITPPIGLNVFMLSSVLTDISSGTIFRGVAPFIAVDIVRLAIIVFVPSVALLLPSLMRY
ncbi:MAG: TRAP transporter large permease [Rhodospirillaceae bacterium]|nr:TRAP transporter large permease [Rhodospirillaceae bacterium]